MRWAVALILLAGCASGPPQAPAETGPAPCPTLHDATFCVDLPRLDVQAQPPSLDEGWGCTIDHDDEAPREFARLYRHIDGRLGYEWRWPLPDWTHRFTVLTLVEPARVTWAIAEHQQEGFAEFSAAPQGGEGLASISNLALRLDERVDGQWRPIEGARLDMGLVDGVGYYVWSWMDEGVPVHLDITVPHEERRWSPASLVADINGRTVSAAVKSYSSSFEAQYWGHERVLMGDCTLESLPGGL